MSYSIQSIELYVRDTKPGRVVFSLGRKGGTGDLSQATTNPLGHVRMVVRDSQGNESFGCAGDRLSVRWLDKRPGRSKSLKLNELVSLIETSREIYLQKKEFDSPFAMWRDCYSQILKVGRSRNQEDLTSCLASGLFERAMVDAVCRLSGKSMFRMVKDGQLGIQPETVHPELKPLNLEEHLPARPRTQIAVRHTIGLKDVLREKDIQEKDRVNDGLPETLEEYIKIDGIRHFKIKVSGDPDYDVKRLSQIWEVVVKATEPVITLDANESYQDLKTLDMFVQKFEDELIGMFQHVECIEQPLPRSVQLNRENEKWIRKINERKPLIIDESDGDVNAFKRAFAAGFAGTSHKNCKGFFKSLLNYGLLTHYSLQGRFCIMTAEDLQNLPVVPLQQDFASVAMLGIEHCERNGHHYNYGLSMLSEKDKQRAAKHHPDLYTKRGDEYFLKIVDGQVQCRSLQCSGFGLQDEPDWPSMTPMRTWLKKNYPA
jgi:hypothetical protein